MSGSWLTWSNRTVWFGLKTMLLNSSSQSLFFILFLKHVLRLWDINFASPSIFLILIKYSIFYETIFPHMIIIHRLWFFFFFFFLNKKKSTFLWDNHPLFLMFIKYFFCEIVYLYMIVGFLLSKILPPLFLLVFKFKLNYKFIQSTIFIFIF